MELLLTALIWLWQIGWVLVLGGGLCALALWLLRPLRKRKLLTFAVCTAAVCVLLAVLCMRPIVLGEAGAKEKTQAQQLAAGPYSDRLPMVTPVCAVAEKTAGGMEVQVWYAFVGRMTYVKDGDGWSIIEWLFPWN